MTMFVFFFESGSFVGFYHHAIQGKITRPAGIRIYTPGDIECRRKHWKEMSVNKSKVAAAGMLVLFYFAHAL